MSTVDGYYLQISGLAIRSPVAPLLAIIWHPKYDDEFREEYPKLYMRYVDDIITILDKGDAENKLM